MMATCAGLGGVAAETWGPGCRRMKDIFPSGKEICEVMWDGAFKYETDESKAFTMWWFEAGNPNDQMTLDLGKPAADICDVQYFHKPGAPTAESANFTECHPWQESACCYEATVTTHDALRVAYGPGYEWDRCGKLSQACERFFVQEACMYECDVNLANYRRCTDDEAAAGAVLDAGLPTETDCTDNYWQIWEMPIKASYCDAWYDACYEDYFCGAGSYFSCAADLSPSDSPEVVEVEVSKKKTKKELPASMIILIVVLGVLFVLISVLVCFMYSSERKGKPVFKPLSVRDQAGNTEMM